MKLCVFLSQGLHGGYGIGVGCVLYYDIIREFFEEVVLVSFEEEGEGVSELSGCDEFIFVIHLIDDVGLILVLLFVELVIVVGFMLLVVEGETVLLELFQTIDVFFAVHVFYIIFRNCMWVAIDCCKLYV